MKLSLLLAFSSGLLFCSALDGVQQGSAGLACFSSFSCCFYMWMAAKTANKPPHVV